MRDGAGNGPHEAGRRRAGDVLVPPEVSARETEDVRVPLSSGFILSAPESQHPPSPYFPCYGAKRPESQRLCSGLRRASWPGPRGSPAGRHLPTESPAYSVTRSSFLLDPSRGSMHHRHWKEGPCFSPRLGGEQTQPPFPTTVTTGKGSGY